MFKLLIQLRPSNEDTGMKFAMIETMGLFENIVPHNLTVKRQDRPGIMRILSMALSIDPCKISRTNLRAKRFENETVSRRKHFLPLASFRFIPNHHHDSYHSPGTYYHFLATISMHHRHMVH
jgi:hypothetical protein